ncbi:hypothetical protein PVAND_007537 [Polypedilum vanderplanki]|uniref:Uncharacterized protein n=1 Tax=Polypedilum vanderplanki TaxID=319348 RepID=A0A9J6C6Z1_POLVA|nr:hypothetical protein PVAND_007537 [Polypedilum vanderplanki]
MKLGKILLKSKVLSSEVLTKYLIQTNKPPWTSYFIKMKDCENDLKGLTSFNWKLDTGENYHILRTACWPYIKFHCTKTKIAQDLTTENKFYELMKKINLGIPLLAYGIAAIFLIRHEEVVHISDTIKIKIYFLIPEDKGSSF